MSIKKQTTSWGGVAGWYSDYLESNDDTYQKQVILPNLLRLISFKRGDRVLDLACGQGFFSREFFKKGATVHGVDISLELVEIAKKLSPKEISFTVSKAEELSFVASGSVDIITIILAIQNIEQVKTLMSECLRALSPKGKLCIVMNHPAFRVLRGSGWGYDEAAKTQYRRIDRYLSESRESIDMHPGQHDGEKTISFHRPLQYYFKLLHNGGFAVSRMEEWISHKKSETGPRKDAEDKARKEVPLFLFLEAVPTTALSPVQK